MNIFCFRALMSHSSLENTFELWWWWKDVALGADSFGGVICTAHPLLMVCLHCESETHLLLCKVESETENWFEIRERRESFESVCNPNPVLIFTSMPCLLPLGTWGCGWKSAPTKWDNPSRVRYVTVVYKPDDSGTWHVLGWWKFAFKCNKDLANVM